MALAWTHRAQDFPQLGSLQCVAADGLVVVLGFRVEEPYGLQSVLLDPRDCSWRYGSRLEGIYDEIFCAAAVRREVFVLFCVNIEELGLVKVHKMDTGTLQWTCVETSGEIPTGILCKYACVIDEFLFLFARRNWSSDEDVSEEGLEVRRPGIYALDLTTWSWRFVSKGYPFFPLPQTSAVVGRCVYSLQHVDSGRRHVLMWWDSETLQFGSLHVDAEYMVSIKSCALLVYEGHILMLRLERDQDADYRIGIRGKWSGTALRCDADGRRWTTPMPVYGVPPSCIYIDCAAVVGDRTIVILSPLFGMNLRAEDEVRVLDMALGLRTLCLLAVRRHGLDHICLPRALQRELQLLPPPPCPTPIPPSFSSDTSAAGKSTGGRKTSLKSALAIRKKR